MKKIIGIVVAMMMVAGVAFAQSGGYSYTGQNMAEVAGGDGIGLITEDLGGVNGGWATGTTENTYAAKVGPRNKPVTAMGGSMSEGEVNHENDTALYGHVGYAVSDANVASDAGTTTSHRGDNDVTVYGRVAQGNYAGSTFGTAPVQGQALTDNYVNAGGGQNSNASYNGLDSGNHSSGIHGDADVIGGTIAGSYIGRNLPLGFTTGNPQQAAAGAATGSLSNANLSEHGIVTVYGVGGVGHTTVAVEGTPGNYAHTYGTAGYEYTASRNHATGITGYGGAATGGVSTVGFTATGMTATAMSGGVAHANSGTGVSTPSFNGPVLPVSP